MNIGIENRTCLAFSSGLSESIGISNLNLNTWIFPFWKILKLLVNGCRCEASSAASAFSVCTLFKSVFTFYFFFQKIIQSYVKTPILHCYFGTLLPVDIDPKAKYVYFLRRSTAKIGKITCSCIHRVLIFTHISITTNFPQIVLLIMICICGSLFILTMFDVITHSLTLV